MVTRKRARDIPPIERVPRRLQTRATAALCGGFLVDQIFNRTGQIGLHEQIARPWRCPAGEVNVRIPRPTAVIVLGRGDNAARQHRHRESVPRKPNRRRRDVSERHRSPTLQRGDPSVGRGRYEGAENARRYPAVMVTVEQVERSGLRPPAQPADRENVSGRGRPDHDRRHPAETDIFRLQYAEGDTAADAGIDGISARFEDLKSGLCGQVVARCNHMPRADYPGSGR